MTWESLLKFAATEKLSFIFINYFSRRYQFKDQNNTKEVWKRVLRKLRNIDYIPEPAVCRESVS